MTTSSRTTSLRTERVARLRLRGSRLVPVGRALAWIALTAAWCVAAASLGPVVGESLFDVLQVEFTLWGGRG